MERMERMDWMDWMEGGHARGGSGHRLQLHPRGETNPGKQANWSGLLPWEMLPGKSYPGNLTAVRRHCVDGLVLPVYSRRICVVIEYSCP